jgi:hypothetical protein
MKCILVSSKLTRLSALTVFLFLLLTNVGNDDGLGVNSVQRLVLIQYKSIPKYFTYPRLRVSSLIELAIPRYSRGRKVD